MKHICKKALSENLYKALDGLSPTNPVMVTNHGKPDMLVVKATPNNIAMYAQSSQLTDTSRSFSAQAMSLSDSRGFTSEQRDEIINSVEKLLGVKLETSSPKLEAKSEENK